MASSMGMSFVANRGWAEEMEEESWKLGVCVLVMARRGGEVR
jgi:hypothetical protein